ncbi:DUF7096 domain-containing protein [Salinibaculum rarum]|uniref:DUF7096 domain-containing protein n=1 Tax=Salinibaculum rarum TaxID=3058903 RepID=UPI00265DABC0|nr:hypothetical protein [Salinibaculum sp. KK48]
MNRTAIAALVLAVVAVVGMTAPAVALSPSPGVQSVDGVTDEPVTAPQMENESVNDSQTETGNDSRVNVTVGQQLSTVISTSSDEVQTEFENTAFELSVETDNEEEQAEAVADRAEELRDRAEDIREDYEDATEAYDEGDITRSQYAQQLATLNARASNMLGSYERLQDRAANVSALELRAAGLNQTALDNAVGNLSVVSGTGAAGLLDRFTGQSQGEIELETSNGLEIEIESEDGEWTRGFERPQQGNGSFVVDQSTALDTARGVLSTDRDGDWTLSALDRDDGAYEFEFAFYGPNHTGEAEVSVDGETGEVFALEEEIERRDDDDDDSEADDNDGEDDEDDSDDEDEDDESEGPPLSLSLVNGTATAGGTVTVSVFAGGEPVAGASVELDDQHVGTTDENGTIAVTLPDDDEAELKVESGDREAELEFTLRQESSDDRTDREISERLDVSGSVDNGTVSVRATYDGAGLANVSVLTDGNQVGTTDGDGTLTFQTNATEELEVTLLKGQLEAELSFEIGDDGTLALDEVGIDQRDEDEVEADDEDAEGDDDESEEEDADDDSEETDTDDGEDEEDDEETEDEDDEESDDEDEEDEEEDGE